MADPNSSSHVHIRAWRKHLGMTQEELAAKVELSTPGISMIENGKQGITLAKLEQIAVAMEISLPDLLSAPPTKAGKAEAQIKREILEIYDRLPAHLQPVYLSQARTLLTAAQAAEPATTEKKSSQ